MLGRVDGRCWMGCRTMEWNRNWRFWRVEAKAGEPRNTHDWVTRLVEKGVSKESASRIAERLEPAYAELGRGSAVALLRGATLSVEAQAIDRADTERNLRDFREVQRLLGAFSGELEKLDEVLEVLAAYAQRMRSEPNRPPNRTLH